MATAGGPNIERDGLVFGMDTGYGVADKNVPTRFYQGESTANIALLPLFKDGSGNPSVADHGNFGFGDNNSLQTTTIPSALGSGYAARVVKNTSSNGTIVMINPMGTNLTNGDKVTVTWYVKGIGPTIGQTVHIHTYASSADGAVSTGTDYTSALTGEWKRFSHTFTWTKTVNSYSSVYSYCRVPFSTGTEFLVSNPQVELYKDHATPFTDGTRSSTQSLIDLTKTIDIDVSNVSFDSTGQPTFDGTDDRIDIPVIALTDFTITQVLNMDNVDNQMPIGGGLYTNGADYRGYVWFFKGVNQVRVKVDGEVGPNFGVNVSAWGGKWISYTATRAGDTYKLYINGQQVDQTRTGSTNQFSVRTIGWGYSNSYAMQGDLPVTKIYNRALSADEVQQNYNAYKNRFNL